ncbi:hypothetical protein HELRODRAFT_194117 [Helobdella robusta]|uniref:Transcription initiation factor TFIID subunit 1 n=1 Tax=Helobdella robusta TaxID=6412 RepID=T1FVP9_HELRO|nr:hypothetical protein HELRODRAFT_194117 [Helobdella robusta]ESN93291.1 hypothetical protein HELRODRAFT_194117 [Helobdella robusta]
MGSIDSESNDQTAVLTGFLFGNIDESGNLEEDFLDEESRRRIGFLAGFGIESFVKEIAEGNEDGKGPEEACEASSTNLDDNFDSKSKEIFDSEVVSTCPDGQIKSEFSKSDNAVDYFDINEVADDDNFEVEELKKEVKEEEPVVVVKQEPKPPAQTLNTPLASLLPPQLAGEDVRKWFPEFRTNEVLRFSRLFKPAHLPNIWKKKKKPSKDQQPNSFENSRLKIKETAPRFEHQHPLQVSTNSNNIQKLPSENKRQKKKKKKKRSTVAAEAVGGMITDENAVKKKHKKKKKKKNNKEDNDCHDLDNDGFYHDEFIMREKKPEIIYGRLPTPNELALDDMEYLMRPEQPSNQFGDGGEGRDNPNKPEVADWRYGPSRLWYDMLGVPDNGAGFHYGFQLKQQTSAECTTSAVNALLKSEEDDREAKATAAAARVDDDVVAVADGEAVDGRDKKAQVNIPEEAYYMITQSHWEDDIIWNGEDVKVKVMQGLRQRAARAGWIPTSNARTYEQFISQYEPNTKINAGYSMFPVENEELAMDKLPEPSILTLDPDDENLILDIPDDYDVKQLHKQQQQHQLQQQTNQDGTKKEKESKKSKMLLGKAGILKDEEDNNNNMQEEPDIIQKHPFNLSNDEYYNPKLTTDNALGRNMGGSVIQHSTPAIELRQPFFPCHLSILKLRNFHRSSLKKYSHGAMTSPGPHPVLPLIKQIRRKEKLREQERLASGGGEMFFMRTADDLTSRDGEVVLAEYSEQYPPLVNQIGMATKIKNYYKRRPGQETSPPEFKYGELAYAHTSPFLGALQPGQCVTAFENNMFRAPLYEHKMNCTDFLIIRNRNHYYIREADAIFVVGQECPLIEVPGPNSKRANNFLRDFLQLFIYRLFWMSRDNPRRIKMEDIRKAFPSHSESSIRKRLKLCADFKRTGIDSNWWVWKRDCRLPSEEEMREMVSCEQCCAYYSMLAAEQRLKDAGYGEKSLFSNEEENEDDVQAKMEDEVKAAPWNTTHAYISAMKGKCLLALNGVADPTGCGEGFSYVKIPNKPQLGKDDQSNQLTLKRSVTGTDADLRRLPLKDAKNLLLRKFGFDEATVKKLGRWEVINVVRTLSTEQAKSSQDGSAVDVMATSPNNNNNNNNYSSNNNNYNSNYINYDNNNSNGDQPAKRKTKTEDKLNVKSQKECPMFLKSVAPSGIAGNVAMSEEQQEQLEKEDLVDDELVNIEDTRVILSKNIVKRAEEIKKKSLMLKIPKMLKEEKKKKVSSANLQEDYLKKPKKLLNRRRADPVVTLSTILEVILNEMRELPISTQFLFPVNVKKNIRSRKYQSREAFLADVNQIVRNCEIYNGAKHPLTASAQKMLDYCLQRISEKEDKLARLEKAINPLLDDDDMASLSFIITGIIEDRLKTIEGSVQFHTPVNKKQYKDYYDVIKQPIDLSTMHKKATDHQYRSHKEFLSDVELLVNNCLRYNGPINPLSKTADVILQTCKAALIEQATTLETLEANIQATQEAALDAVENESVSTIGAATSNLIGGEPAKPSKRGRKKLVKFSVGDDDSRSNMNALSDDNSNSNVIINNNNRNNNNNDNDDDDDDVYDDDDDDGGGGTKAKRRKLDTGDDVLVDVEGEEDDDDYDDDNSRAPSYAKAESAPTDGGDDNDTAAGDGADNDFDPQEFFNSLVAQGENNGNSEEIIRNAMRGDDDDEEDDEELMMIEGAASSQNDLVNDLQLSDSEESDQDGYNNDNNNNINNINNNSNNYNDDDDDDNDNDNDRSFSGLNDNAGDDEDDMDNNNNNNNSNNNYNNSNNNYNDNNNNNYYNNNNINNDDDDDDDDGRGEDSFISYNGNDDEANNDYNNNNNNNDDDDDDDDDDVASDNNVGGGSSGGGRGGGGDLEAGRNNMAAGSDAAGDDVIVVGEVVLSDNDGDDDDFNMSEFLHSNND